MAGGVDLAKVIDGDFGVELGGGHRGVTEQLLDHTDVGASGQQVRGEGVAQDVGRNVPTATGQAGAIGGLLERAPGGLARQRPAQSVEEDLRRTK